MTVPVVSAYWIPTYQQIAFWCIHCKTPHTHGDSGAGPAGGGNRVAHCHRLDSPYRVNGYDLDVVGQIGEVEEIKSARRPKRAKKIT